jgi:hypothetical protein
MMTKTSLLDGGFEKGERETIRRRHGTKREIVREKKGGARGGRGRLGVSPKGMYNGDESAICKRWL